MENETTNPTRTETPRCDCYAPLPIAAVGASQRTICDDCLAAIRGLSARRPAATRRRRSRR